MTKYKIALSYEGNGRRKPEVYISEEQINEMNKMLKEDKKVSGFFVFLEKIKK